MVVVVGWHAQPIKKAQWNLPAVAAVPWAGAPTPQRSAAA
jgi:hypothetical protein